MHVFQRVDSIHATDAAFSLFASNCQLFFFFITLLYCKEGFTFLTKKWEIPKDT